MKLDIIMQNEEVNLKKIIESEMSLKPKKMYIFAGTIKESGFEIIEENIIDTKVKLSVYTGIDKKNTTKSLLENILQYASEVYYYNNNELKEFEGTAIIFESDKRAVIYFTSSKISENSFTEDLIMISKITYDLSIQEDKLDYKEKVKEFISIKDLEFKELNKDDISELINSKVIFSNKQYEHNVKSIAELLGKKEAPKKEEKVESDEDIDVSKLAVPMVKLTNDFDDFDIDISGVKEATVVLEPKVEKKNTKKEEKIEAEENVEENDDYEEDLVVEEDDEFSNEVLDLDSMLLEKADVKLKEKKTEKKKEVKKEVSEFEEPELVKVKKVDLNNVTNFMMHLPAKQQNKKDLDIIKIPNYIRDLIPEFFEFPEKAIIVNENGIQSKEREIKIEIIDCINDKKYIDNNSKIFQKKGQTFISILCKDLENIEYDENDIVRIIKLDSDVYHIEIVRQEMQEYKIWNKIMNKDMRATTRKYGIM